MNIFITGISSGAGKALANEFLSKGYNVQGCSRRDIDYSHENLTHFKLDISKTPSLESIHCLDSYDLVILNAGILGEIKKLQNSSNEELKNVMDINLWAQKNLIDLFLKKSKVSSFIAISSGAAVKGSLGWSGYSLSKAALNMLMSLYASEENESKFYALAPGLINTEMQTSISSKCPEEFPNLVRLQEAKANGSMPTPKEFASKFFQSMNWINQFESGSFMDLRSKE
jgi:NAD(P)-dependent dehydrogenase (short-subunit alcohol dehydrogenase family)